MRCREFTGRLPPLAKASRMNDVPGPLLPIETGFMRRCGCPEAAVYGVVQKNPEPAIAGGRSVSIK